MTTDSILYTGAAEYGKFKAIIGFIFGTIAGIGSIIGGIYLLKKKTHRTGSVIGTIIKDPNCQSNIVGRKTQYICNLEIKYNIDGKEYTITTLTDSYTRYGINNTIKLYYDPNNISDIQIISDSTRTPGIIFIIFGIIILLSVSIQLYFVIKYKSVAAVGGGVGLIGDISSIIRR